MNDKPRTSTFLPSPNTAMAALVAVDDVHVRLAYILGWTINQFGQTTSVLVFSPGHAGSRAIPVRVDPESIIQTAWSWHHAIKLLPGCPCHPAAGHDLSAQETP